MTILVTAFMYCIYLLLLLYVLYIGYDPTPFFIVSFINIPAA